MFTMTNIQFIRLSDRNGRSVYFNTNDITSFYRNDNDIDTEIWLRYDNNTPFRVVETPDEIAKIISDAS